MEQEILTDEQLWLLCEEEEKKKKIVAIKSHDKAVDWDYEQLNWSKWNPKNFK
jgi:hypothetical protein